MEGGSEELQSPSHELHKLPGRSKSSLRSKSGLSRGATNRLSGGGGGGDDDTAVAAAAEAAARIQARADAAAEATTAAAAEHLRRSGMSSEESEEEDDAPKKKKSVESLPSLEGENQRKEGQPLAVRPEGIKGLIIQKQAEDNFDKIMNLVFDDDSEDEEGKPKEKLSWKRRAFANCFLWLCDLLMCRTRARRRARRRSAWASGYMGDWSTRLISLRQKRAQVFEETVAFLKEDKELPYRKFVFKVLRLQWLHFREAMVGCYHRDDSRTGLPRRMLERWQLNSIEHDGAHGLVFKVQEMRRGYKAPKPEDPVFAMRVRDKARGRVMQLPLIRATKVLNTSIIWGGKYKVVQKLLSVCRLRKAKFRHEAICVQRAVYNSWGFFVEIVEWLPGPSLEKFMEDHKVMMDEYASCRVYVRVLEALKYMHSRKIIHRDVRAPQIIFAEKGNYDSVKLCDFWCAASLPKKGSFHDDSIPMDVYRACPEVLKFGLWSPKADVWSATCTLFEMLQGHPPFGGHGAALVDRICNGKIEFDTTCGTISLLAQKMLKLCFKRVPNNRPTAADALKNAWVQAYNREKPVKSVKRQGLMIKTVQLTGKLPLARRGFEAPNVLDASTGMIQAGFCSFMGITNFHMDFEIIGKAEWQEYWVTHVLVSLWANSENPKELTCQVQAREGAPWVDIATHTVESAASSEARLEVDRPMRRARLQFRGNFGGHHGIALRKVAFYGYECRSITVSVDPDKCYNQRGSEVFVHNDKILERAILGHTITKQEMMLDKAHPSLQLDILKSVGKRVPGANHRYRKYVDIKSGKPHHSSNCQMYLQCPIGATISAAALGLRYVSHSPPEQKGPQVRIDIIHGPDEHDMVRETLFHTESLKPPHWHPKDIIYKGYIDHPYMFVGGLEINTDHKISLEIIFENYSGYIHLPLRLGLQFFYVPFLSTPSEASDDYAEDVAVARMNRRAGFIEKSQDQNLLELAKERRRQKMMADDEEFSDNAGDEPYELELRADMRELELITAYGHFGVADPEAIEIGAWRPTLHERGEAVEDRVEQGVRRKDRWWEGGDDEDSLKEKDGWGAEGSGFSASTDSAGGFGGGGGTEDSWGGGGGKKRGSGSGWGEDNSWGGSSERSRRSGSPASQRRRSAGSDASSLSPGATLTHAQRMKAETPQERAERIQREMQVQLENRAEAFRDEVKQRKRDALDKKRRRQLGLEPREKKEEEDDEEVPEDEEGAEERRRKKKEQEEGAEPVKWCGVEPPSYLVDYVHHLPEMAPCAQGLPGSSTCAKGLRAIPKAAALPLVLCGFTPGAPPPSPRDRGWKGKNKESDAPAPVEPGKSILRGKEDKPGEADKTDFERNLEAGEEELFPHGAGATTVESSAATEEWGS